MKMRRESVGFLRAVSLSLSLGWPPASWKTSDGSVAQRFTTGGQPCVKFNRFAAAQRPSRPKA
jgi:hypothetical protein